MSPSLLLLEELLESLFVFGGVSPDAASTCSALSASLIAFRCALRSLFSCFSSSVFSSFFSFHSLHESTPQFHFIHLLQALCCILTSSRFISASVSVSCDCVYGCGSGGGGGPWNEPPAGAACVYADENPPNGNPI